MSAYAGRLAASSGRVRTGAFLRDPAWWVCFLSFLSLGLTQAGIMFSTAGGTLAPALFLALWLGLAGARPAASVQLMLDRRLPYALPLLALASVLWSVDPAHTGRMAAEFLVVVAVSTFAARRVSASTMVSGLMLATLLQVGLSVVSGVHQDIVSAGNEALSGLFGSKNYMGYVGALLGLLALASLADAALPWLLRLAAAAGVALGCLVVVQARSADALLAFGMGIAPLVYVLLLRPLSAHARVLVNAAVALIGLAGAALAYFLRDELMQLVLTATGKDASLTGRTYLWDHARQFIALRPLRGVGYEAFWEQGNPDAEGLWSHFGIVGRGGFSFHNMYYQISVDLGALGAAVWFGVFAIILVAVLVAALRRPSAPIAFFLAFLVFTAIRLSVETELAGPFDLGPIVLTAAWIYATGTERKAAKLG